MTKTTDDAFETLRDGAETLPEFEDLGLEMQSLPRSTSDELLEEALIESFPASDPPASGRID
ncbi:hypothetical protein GGQ64_004800 [Rhizobium azooxidifex]|uniref:Uncharacterized protein n=1 Tax=Mycoplana azooxidifex TaxID=1636188 RepID=A0A7W6DE33_9HYPH|nr:hypothetical protein [Mycoplana azooxidifex]MBB3979556.1 hypothetical protein [Mycoplana azooxidifex]